MAKKIKNTNVEEIVSPTKLMIQRFKKNKLAVIGLVVFIILTSLILISKAYITITDYNLANVDLVNKYQGPSLANPFGTDDAGRNYMPRVFLGGYISLQVGILATVISTTLGILVGGISGFYGKKVDMILMRVTEIVSSFPFLPIAITISVLFVDIPEQQRLYVMMFVIGILGWTSLARMIRGQILSLREQEFMTAARALGITKRQQILKHLIPNTVAYIIVNATTAFAGAILSEASLAFLGLSVNEPIPTWGALLSAASTSTIMKNYWWMWVFPGVLLFTLIMSINLIGEGLRDSVDPKAHIKFKKQAKISLFSKIFKKKEVNA